jgi:hypothetical protein
MFTDLGPGERIRFGNGVALTVLDVEGSHIRFALERADRVPDTDEKRPAGRKTAARLTRTWHTSDRLART